MKNTTLAIFFLLLNIGVNAQFYNINDINLIPQIQFGVVTVNNPVSSQILGESQVEDGDQNDLKSTGDIHSDNVFKLLRHSGAQKLPPPCTPVSITTHPQSQSVTAGNTATFSVTAAGTAPFLYFWYKNGTFIPGATNSTYTTPVLALPDNANTYHCTVTTCNQSNQAISNTGLLTITSGPCTAVSITTHPQNQSVSVGSTATFSVTAGGDAPFLYFWYKNGTFIPGATNFTYTTDLMGVA